MAATAINAGAFFGVERYLMVCTGVPADALKGGLGRLDAFKGRLG